MEGNQCKFQIGEMVWARTTGYPWWPAKIYFRQKAESKQNNNKNSYFVMYFGDHSQYGTFKIIIFSSKLTQSKLAKYYQNYKEFSLKTKSFKKLGHAISEADRFISQKNTDYSLRLLDLLKDLETKARGQNKSSEDMNISSIEQKECIKQSQFENVDNIKQLQQKALQQKQQQQQQIKQSKKKQNVSLQDEELQQNDIDKIQINFQNVIELLQDKILNKLKKKCSDEQYSKQKQYIRSLLLEKYNMKKQKNIQQSQNITKRIYKRKGKPGRKPKHLIRIQPKKQIKLEFKKNLILKIYGVIRNKIKYTYQSRKISIYLGNTLLSMQNISIRQQLSNLGRWINNKCAEQILDTYDRYFDCVTQMKKRLQEQTSSKYTENIEI